MNLNTPILCIGGVRDGEMLAYDDPRMEQPRLRSVADASYEEYIPLPVPIEPRDVYHREMLTFPGGNRLMFWRLSDLTTFEAVERVFRNYVKK